MKSDQWYLRSEIQKNWIPNSAVVLATHSLTKHLQALTHNQIVHHVLGETWNKGLLEEYIFLQEPPFSTLWQRDIAWSMEKEIWIKARVLVSENTFAKHTHIFSNLQNNPLGDILFSVLNAKRTHFEFAKITGSNPYFAFLKDNAESIIARRSIFEFDQDKLMVVEFFLPAFFTYAHLSCI